MQLITYGCITLSPSDGPLPGDIGTQHPASLPVLVLPCPGGGLSARLPPQQSISIPNVTDDANHQRVLARITDDAGHQRALARIIFTLYYLSLAPLHCSLGFFKLFYFSTQYFDQTDIHSKLRIVSMLRDKTDARERAITIQLSSCQTYSTI